MTTDDPFSKIVDDLRRLNAKREAMMLDAFKVLGARLPDLAEAVGHNVGDRVRAARWMCMQQRAFGGRSAYEALADGDGDRVWDRVLGDDGKDGSSGGEARLAY